MDFNDEFLYFLKKNNASDLSILESIIYFYLFLFKNENYVEKIICFYDDNFSFVENKKLDKKLENVEIFATSISNKNKAIFHITHVNKISKNNLDLLDEFFKLDLIKEYRKFNDIYCPYSITFELII